MKNVENTPARDVVDVATQIGNVVREVVYECWKEEEDSHVLLAPKQVEEKKVPVVVWVEQRFDEALDDLAAEVEETKSVVVRKIIGSYLGNHDRSLKADQGGQDVFDYRDPFGQVEKFLYPRIRRKRAQSRTKRRIAG